MPIQPDGVFEVAKELAALKVPVGERRYRTITGRCYYAVYLATRDAICTLYGLPAESNLSHFLVSDTLAKQDGDPPVKVLGILLATLHGQRKDADYKLRALHEESESDSAIENATKAMALLQQVRGRLPRIEPGRSV